MKEFNAEKVRIETGSALETARQSQAQRKYPAYIGLDVHKQTIAVAVARVGRAAPESRGEIGFCWTFLGQASNYGEKADRLASSRACTSQAEKGRPITGPS